MILGFFSRSHAPHGNTLFRSSALRQPHRLISVGLGIRVGASITVGTIFVFSSRATGWEARATALIDAPILSFGRTFAFPGGD